VANASKDARSLNEVRQQLDAAGVAYNRQTGVLSSSDLTQELFDLIQRRTDSDVFFTRVGANGVFFQVKGVEARPLEGDAAINIARQAMRADALTAELGMAAYSAKLEAKFEGDYANLMNQAEPKPE
jgi:hypothetical protein